MTAQTFRLGHCLCRQHAEKEANIHPFIYPSRHVLTTCSRTLTICTCSPLLKPKPVRADKTLGSLLTVKLGKANRGEWNVWSAESCPLHGHLTPRPGAAPPRRPTTLKVSNRWSRVCLHFRGGEFGVAAAFSSDASLHHFLVVKCLIRQERSWGSIAGWWEVSASGGTRNCSGQGRPACLKSAAHHHEGSRSSCT